MEDLVARKGCEHRFAEPGDVREFPCSRPHCEVRSRPRHREGDMDDGGAVEHGGMHGFANSLGKRFDQWLQPCLGPVLARRQYGQAQHLGARDPCAAAFRPGRPPRTAATLTALEPRRAGRPSCG